MPAPKGNQYHAKPGEAARLSLRYNKADAELLRKAWRLDMEKNAVQYSFEDWLRTICYNYPLTEAKRIIAFYEED